jgi:uncharacterized repeat protein (TIGR03803 family)
MAPPAGGCTQARPTVRASLKTPQPSGTNYPIKLPASPLYATDGNYYGVTGQQDGSGNAFRVTPAGSLTNIYSFPANTFIGVNGWVSLIQAADGNLYGLTPGGGANGTGTIYELTLSNCKEITVAL